MDFLGLEAVYLYSKTTECATYNDFQEAYCDNLYKSNLRQYINYLQGQLSKDNVHNLPKNKSYKKGVLQTLKLIKELSIDYPVVHGFHFPYGNDELNLYLGRKREGTSEYSGVRIILEDCKSYCIVCVRKYSKDSTNECIETNYKVTNTKIEVLNAEN